MQIREMKFAELPEVIELHLEGLKEELSLLSRVFPGKSVDQDGVPQLQQLLTQILRSGEGQIFVAGEPGAAVGYCLATKKVYPAELPKLCGCINGIFVREPHKRQGVGTALFRRAVEWLKHGGVSYLELYHMINDERAAAFWRKMGFTPVQINCAMKI